MPVGLSACFFTSSQLIVTVDLAKITFIIRWMFRKNMKISELKSGMRNVSITGKIESVGEPRTVNLKAGGTNTVADAVISDDSGSIKLSLWGEDIDKIHSGDKVSVENGYINTFKGENSLAVGKFGKLKKL
jgi:replication factor A1